MTRVGWCPVIWAPRSEHSSVLPRASGRVELRGSGRVVLHTSGREVPRDSGRVVPRHLGPEVGTFFRAAACLGSGGAA